MTLAAAMTAGWWLVLCFGCSCLSLSGGLALGYKLGQKAQATKTAPISRNEAT